MKFKFLVTSREDMQERGWDQLDVILISGDAYVDHHSFGTSLIGRLLEAHGYKVGIISQPDCENFEDFKQLGEPKLFFGVSSGNVDSMIANYTANKRLRSDDAFSPDNKAGLRPDRAVIRYSNALRTVYKDSVIVLGGIEASLRRVAHYDYWSNKVRRSIIVDARADILAYGMAERSILEIAQQLKDFDFDNEEYEKRYFPCLENIAGTVIVRPSYDKRDVQVVESYEEVIADQKAFISAFKKIHDNQDPFTAIPIVQGHGDRYVIHYPPSEPLSTKDMDGIYALPFNRVKHPKYSGHRIKAEEMIANSIVSHRGCPGECNFCGLYYHQGRIVQSRSKRSIMQEVEKLLRSPLFRGTITDVGGPSANLYMAYCKNWKENGACPKRQCLMPSKCQGLKLAYDKQMDLLRSIKATKGVKHVFLQSGLRYDLLVDHESQKYLKYICGNHISGQMKVAPEHVSDNTLSYMNKPKFEVYKQFKQRFRDVLNQIQNKLFLVNYYIIAHPGSTMKDAALLSNYLKTTGVCPEQVQDFIPLPMTVSGVMYYTGKNPLTGEKVPVIKSIDQRKKYRSLLQDIKPSFVKGKSNKAANTSVRGQSSSRGDSKSRSKSKKQAELAKIPKKYRKAVANKKAKAKNLKPKNR